MVQCDLRLIRKVCGVFLFASFGKMGFLLSTLVLSNSNPRTPPTAGTRSQPNGAKMSRGFEDRSGFESQLYHLLAE